MKEVPLEISTEAAKPYVSYRRDDSFAVWDSRGLTLRKAGNVKSYHLTDFAVSPKIFQPEEIKKTTDLVHQGARSLAASSLAGSRRLGQRVFFLVRWTGRDGNPWLETLVQVDLEDRELRPKLVGRFDGFSTASKSIDDCLFLQQGGVAAVTRRPSDWGVANYSFSGRDFDYVSLGEKLTSWLPSGFYIEQSSYGTTVGGKIDNDSLQPKLLFEDRGTVSWLDAEVPPIAVFRSAGKIVLRDCESGAEQSLSSAASYRRTAGGILAWSPAEHPRHAVLLEPGRWSKLAIWNSKPQRRKRRASR